MVMHEAMLQQSTFGVLHIHQSNKYRNNMQHPLIQD